MTHNFKVGDKVRPTRDNSDWGLTIRKDYEIRTIERALIAVKNDFGSIEIFHNSYFRKVEDSKVPDSEITTFSLSKITIDIINKFDISIPGKDTISLTPQEARDLMNKLRVALKKLKTL